MHVNSHNASDTRKYTLIYIRIRKFLFCIIFICYNGTQGLVRIDLQFGPDSDHGPEFEKPWSKASTLTLHPAGRKEAAALISLLHLAAPDLSFLLVFQGQTIKSCYIYRYCVRLLSACGSLPVQRMYCQRLFSYDLKRCSL